MTKLDDSSTRRRRGHRIFTDRTLLGPDKRQDEADWMSLLPPLDGVRRSRGWGDQSKILVRTLPPLRGTFPVKGKEGAGLRPLLRDHLYIVFITILIIAFAGPFNDAIFPFGFVDVAFGDGLVLQGHA
jgi:hypothetical protein